ncbi:MAG: UDP-N-acetylglucosamine--N-acetylmuramyl-(pentapeptide) pyrophosphoryl-undecaprenol N-acetylglucosamine transferase [Clostridia bacterium]|nr:UDP-N-acetylglucosamine--N-acetylmuramyl-(pentapeptide) pyrophosphoryl-undecaprenol N-acetylglucosamine transferase [Clostridia bacterium]
MRVLMTGGGTAGHVNPAIAIANTIKEYEPESEIAFVCSRLARDKAQDLVPRAGYESLYRVDICGSYPIWNPKNLKTAYLMIKSKRQAKKIIEKFKPDVIIGTGGFACYPVLNAGADMGIPTLVHESNAIPGKAVKKLARKVDCVMTNFESSAKMISGAKKIIHVGNPNVIGQKKTEDGEIAKGYAKSVLIFGGSLGAETLNRAVVRMLEKIADKYPDTEFYHAAGKRDYDALGEIYKERGLSKKSNVKLVDYIYDMDARMKRADLVISRAGAMTISELSLLGKAAILVPSPYVAANHQYKNAKALYDAGACELIEESEFDGGKLTSATERLLSSKAEREQMRESIKAFAKPEANRIIYEEIIKTIQNKSK